MLETHFFSPCGRKNKKIVLQLKKRNETLTGDKIEYSKHLFWTFDTTITGELQMVGGEKFPGGALTYVQRQS